MYVEIVLKDLTMVNFEKFITFDYKINSSSNEEILIGNCSAASLDFSIWNADKKYNAYRFKNGTLHLYKDDTKTKRIGIFNIDKVEKSNNSLIFKCTDNMTKLQDELFKGIQTPFTIFSLLVQICNQLNLTLKNTKEQLLNSDLKYDTADALLGKSCREVLKFICEITCSYAIFDENGELVLKWYNLETIKKEIQYNSLKSFTRDEDLTEITGVSVVLGNEEITEGSKEGYDLLLTKDNPLLIPLTQNELKEVLGNIYDKIQGMTYLSCDISLSIDHEIRIGDTLKIYDEDNTPYKIIVSFLNISKIFSMNITSAGENLNRNNDTGTTGGGGSGEQQEAAPKTSISKDENWRDITINTLTDTFLNGISLFGITEKSSALLCYSLSFNCDTETQIKFKMDINGTVIKEIYYNTHIGLNIFTWSEEAVLNYESETNTIKMFLSTEELTDIANIKIYRNQSILTILSVGATVDGGNRTTKIDIKESIRMINLIHFGKKDITTKTFTEEVIAEYKKYHHADVIDIIAALDFKSKQKLQFEDITENVEI